MEILIKIRLYSFRAVSNKLIDVGLQTVCLVNHSFRRQLRSVWIKSGTLPKVSIHTIPVLSKEINKIIQVVPLAENTMVLVQIFLSEADAVKLVFIYFYYLHVFIS